MDYHSMELSQSGGASFDSSGSCDEGALWCSNISPAQSSESTGNRLTLRLSRLKPASKPTPKPKKHEKKSHKSQRNSTTVPKQRELFVKLVKLDDNEAWGKSKRSRSPDEPLSPPADEHVSSPFHDYEMAPSSPTVGINSDPMYDINSAEISPSAEPPKKVPRIKLKTKSKSKRSKKKSSAAKSPSSSAATAAAAAAAPPGPHDVFRFPSDDEDDSSNHVSFPRPKGLYNHHVPPLPLPKRGLGDGPGVHDTANTSIGSSSIFTGNATTGNSIYTETNNVNHTSPGSTVTSLSDERSRDNRRIPLKKRYKQRRPSANRNRPSSPKDLSLGQPFSQTQSFDQVQSQDLPLDLTNNAGSYSADPVPRSCSSPTVNETVVPEPFSPVDDFTPLNLKSEKSPIPKLKLEKQNSPRGGYEKLPPPCQESHMFNDVTTPSDVKHRYKAEKMSPRRRPPRQEPEPIREVSPEVDMPPEPVREKSPVAMVTEETDPPAPEPTGISAAHDESADDLVIDIKPGVSESDSDRHESDVGDHLAAGTRRGAVKVTPPRRTSPRRARQSPGRRSGEWDDIVTGAYVPGRRRKSDVAPHVVVKQEPETKGDREESPLNESALPRDREAKDASNVKDKTATPSPPVAASSPTRTVDEKVEVHNKQGLQQAPIEPVAPPISNEPQAVETQPHETTPINIQPAESEPMPEPMKEQTATMEPEIAPVPGSPTLGLPIGPVGVVERDITSMEFGPAPGELGHMQDNMEGGMLHGEAEENPDMGQSQFQTISMTNMLQMSAVDLGMESKPGTGLALPEPQPVIESLPTGVSNGQMPQTLMVLPDIAPAATPPPQPTEPTALPQQEPEKRDPKQCDICGRKMSRAPDVKRHKIRVHGWDPNTKTVPATQATSSSTVTSSSTIRETSSERDLVAEATAEALKEESLDIAAPMATPVSMDATVSSAALVTMGTIPGSDSLASTVDMSAILSMPPPTVPGATPVEGAGEMGPGADNLYPLTAQPLPTQALPIFTSYSGELAQPLGADTHPSQADVTLSTLAPAVMAPQATLVTPQEGTGEFQVSLENFTPVVFTQPSGGVYSQSTGNTTVYTSDAYPAVTSEPYSQQASVSVAECSTVDLGALGFSSAPAAPPPAPSPQPPADPQPVTSQPEAIYTEQQSTVDLSQVIGYQPILPAGGVASSSHSGTDSPLSFAEESTPSGFDPKQCDICGKRLSRAHDVKRHKKKIHGVDHVPPVTPVKPPEKPKPKPPPVVKKPETKPLPAIAPRPGNDTIAPAVVPVVTQQVLPAETTLDTSALTSAAIQNDPSAPVVISSFDPKQCDICGRRLSRSQDVKRHKRRVHNSETSQTTPPAAVIKPVEDTPPPPPRPVIPQAPIATADLTPAGIQANDSDTTNQSSVAEDSSSQPAMSLTPLGSQDQATSFHGSVAQGDMDPAPVIITPDNSDPDAPVVFSGDPRQCDICGKYMSRAQDVKRHKRIHSGERPYVCPVSECARSFMDLSNFRKHVDKLHGPNATNNAQKQNEAAKVKSSPPAKKKKEEVKEEKKVITEQKKASADTGVRENGMPPPHPLPVEVVDGIPTVIDQTTKQRIQYPHPDYNGNKSQCDFCGKVFTRSRDMLRHRRAHTGERPFECPVCGKKYTDKSNLHKHAKVHEKDGTLPVSSNDDLTQIVNQLWEGVDLLSPMMEAEMDDIDGIGKGELSDYPANLDGAEDGDETDILKKACLNANILPDESMETPALSIEDPISTVPFEYIPPATEAPPTSAATATSVTATTAQAAIAGQDTSGQVVAQIPTVEATQGAGGGDPLSLFAQNAKVFFLCPLCGSCFPDSTGLNHHMTIHEGGANIDLPGQVIAQPPAGQVIQQAEQVIQQAGQVIQAATENGDNSNSQVPSNGQSLPVTSQCIIDPVSGQMLPTMAPMVPDTTGTLGGQGGLAVGTTTEPSDAPVLTQLQDVPISSVVGSVMEGNMNNNALISSGVTLMSDQRPLLTESEQSILDNAITECEKLVNAEAAAKGELDDGKDPCVCRLCGKRIARRVDMQRHLRTHSGEKPYSCNICHRAFLELGNLRKHQRIHQKPSTKVKPKDPVMCELCGLVFRSEIEIAAHRQRTHPSPSITCHLCQQTFSNSKQLIRHLMCKHHVKPAGMRRYRCQICNKYFRKQSHLERHQRTHTGERPFSCRVCERSFTDKSNLQHHMMRMHRTSITQPKLPLDTGTECKTCGKKLNRYSMKRHMLLHTNSKPFRCPICGKTFRDNGNMLKHHRKCRRKAREANIANDATPTSTTSGTLATSTSSTVTNSTSSKNTSGDPVTQNAESLLNTLYPVTSVAPAGSLPLPGPIQVGALTQPAAGAGAPLPQADTALPGGHGGQAELEDMSVDKFALQFLSSIQETDGGHDSFIGDLVPPTSSMAPPVSQDSALGSAPSTQEIPDDILQNIIPADVTTTTSSATGLHTTSVSSVSSIIPSEESMLNLLNTSISSMDTSDNDLDTTHTTDNMADTSRVSGSVADTSHTSESGLDSSMETSEHMNSSDVVEENPGASAESALGVDEQGHSTREAEQPREQEDAELAALSVSELDTSIGSTETSRPVKPESCNVSMDTDDSEAETTVRHFTEDSSQLEICDVLPQGVEQDTKTLPMEKPTTFQEADTDPSPADLASAENVSNDQDSTTELQDKDTEGLGVAKASDVSDICNKSPEQCSVVTEFSQIPADHGSSPTTSPEQTQGTATADIVSGEDREFQTTPTTSDFLDPTSPAMGPQATSPQQASHVHPSSEKTPSSPEHNEHKGTLSSTTVANVQTLPNTSPASISMDTEDIPKESQNAKPDKTNESHHRDELETQDESDSALTRHVDGESMDNAAANAENNGDQAAVNTSPKSVDSPANSPPNPAEVCPAPPGDTSQPTPLTESATTGAAEEDQSASDAREPPVPKEITPGESSENDNQVTSSQEDLAIPAPAQPSPDSSLVERSSKNAEPALPGDKDEQPAADVDVQASTAKEVSEQPGTVKLHDTKPSGGLLGLVPYDESPDSSDCE